MTVHTVQKGESLWKISKMYGVSLESVIAANPQIHNPDQIDVGQKVNIPTGGPGWAEAPVTPFPESTVTEPATPETPAPSNVTPAAPTTPSPAMPTPAEAAPLPEQTPAYPSVPKWEGLWKYVVKNGDSLYKIAKQVGVTLDQLKAANPQVPNPDKIYPGQVLNIPSSGLKPKGNPGYSSLKEQLTAPIGVPPQKELLTKPKEMVQMEKPIPMPAPAPVPAPTPMSPLEFNLQFAPHKENVIQYAPHTYTENVQLQMQQASDPKASVKQEAAIGNPHMHMMQHMAPMMHHPMHLYYLPVTYKKHKKCCGCKCHKKHKKCGCHHHHHPHLMWMHHPHYQMMMEQHMSMYPKTFYREED